MPKRGVDSAGGATRGLGEQLGALLETTSKHATRVAQPLVRSSPGRFASDIVRALRAVLRDFRGEHLSLRAAALTYISAFSLVPLLTVSLALLQALGQNAFERRLHGLIFEVLAPGIREESAEFLERFMTPGSSTAVGSIGFAVLMVSAGSLLRNLDGSLNEIWGVRRKRPLAVRVGIYAGLLLFGPLVGAASFAGTAAVRAWVLGSPTPYAAQLVTFVTTLVIVGGFTLLYFGAPHAHVRLRSALAGGLVAGLLWVGARSLYASVALSSFRHNPLYASLGALPLFLAWLYISWLVLLLGARLSYAVEHASFRASLASLGGQHPRARELVAAQVAIEATLAWLAGGLAPLSRELATSFRVPESLVLEVVERLVHARLLECDRRGGLRPATDPATLTLAHVAQAAHGDPGLAVCVAEAPGDGFERVQARFEQAHCAGLQVLDQTSWLDLALAGRPPLAPLESLEAGAPPAASPPGRTAGGRNP